MQQANSWEHSNLLTFLSVKTDALQAGSLGAQLQAHSLKGPGPLTLQLPISRRVPLEGAELVAFQEQKRLEEMGALQKAAAPQPADATQAEALPTR